MRAPGARGKATVMPFVSPLPASSRVPWVETWCGLLLHLVEGMQLTLVMRTVVTCKLEVDFVVALGEPAFCAGPEGALAPGAVPPAPAASAWVVRPSKQHSSADRTAARESNDRWGASFAKMDPFAPDNLITPNRRPPTLAAVPEQTVQRDRSCVSPSESPARKARAGADWRA